MGNSQARHISVGMCIYQVNRIYFTKKIFCTIHSTYRNVIVSMEKKKLTRLMIHSTFSSKLVQFLIILGDTKEYPVNRI